MPHRPLTRELVPCSSARTRQRAPAIELDLSPEDELSMQSLAAVVSGESRKPWRVLKTMIG